MREDEYIQKKFDSLDDHAKQIMKEIMNYQIKQTFPVIKDVLNMIGNLSESPDLELIGIMFEVIRNGQRERIEREIWIHVNPSIT
jgi:hypothetical protein